MPIKHEIDVFDFSLQLPMRAIFAGSSQSGKTSLITDMLRNQKRLFNNKFDVVKYCYPSYLTEVPVDIHDYLEEDVIYYCGFPTERQILELPSNSLLVLDDLAQEAFNSELISQLFRVISGKNNISVILTTQNYFSKGKFSRDIRNSCNYCCLFRNCCDNSLNKRVAKAFGLNKAFTSAERDVQTLQDFPYFFINQCPHAQRRNFRLFTKIIGNYRIGYTSQGMKAYLILEKTFLKAFKVVEENKLQVLAYNKHENETSKLQNDTNSDHKKKRKRESIAW